jgi:CelD/BcsL family acetyltransferase involved in cellulose biosynthesis
MSAAHLAEMHTDDPRWTSLATSAPGATPFHHPAWVRAIRESYGYTAVVLAALDGTGEVAAGLPLLRVARPGRAAWVALPFTDHCPPLVRDEAALEPFTLGLVRWKAERRSGLEVRAALPIGPGWDAVEVGVRHVLCLDGGPAAVERGLPRPVVRHVRAAQRSGLQARVTHAAADLPAFYRLHLRTRRRLGAPVQPWRFVAALWRHLVEPGLAFAVLAELPGGEPVAAGVFLAAPGPGGAIMKFSASDPAVWDRKPNHLVTWAAIEHACALGNSTLDFGRSELHHAGLRRYKASWGARELPLAHTCLGGAGGSLVGQGRLREAMAAVIRRSPPVVCRALGELLYPLAG